MNMREKIARAIYESRNGAGAVPWHRRDFRHKQPYFDDADAALDALMEPSNDMLEAMHGAMFQDAFDGRSLPMLGAGFEAAIQAVREGK